ncbi:MAG: Stk1 family PASTA domain-containing Ser/Thr kinase [Actinobacteria bacterium]|nr:Stk1 family PASTA domain-containing Ser/Thr kinase [Actinomycetota bacterium]
METTSPADLLGEVIDGRYRVRRLVARGGMATVYEAVDLRLDRVVALKVMHPHLAADPEFVARFEREAKSAARLNHPHVVSVYDQGASDGLVYLAMEYIPGRTLRDIMRAQGRLSPQQAFAIIEPVLGALSDAHRAGFVHRDIKPENILITDDGRVTVADFGLARAMATSSTSATTGMIIGTVAYLSPEQVETGSADARSDIYSTGICLFEMITGRLPHAGESPLAIAYQHVNSDVPAPSQFASGIERDVDAVVITATRRDPHRRYASVDDFLADVQRVRRALPAPETWSSSPSHDTVVVSAPMTTHQWDRPEPRRRRAPWILSLIALALVSAGAGAWWFLQAQTSPAPDVTGLTVAQAQSALAGTGYQLVEGTPEFSETAPAGVIITTDPEPGAGIREAGTMTVIVSQGPERYPIPDLTGLAPDAAVDQLLAVPLATGGRTEVFDAVIPAGQVVGTDPAVGEVVAPNTPVDLLVSKGPEPIQVADLTNRRVAAATGSLEERGLIVNVIERFSEKIEQGRVIGQSPAPGTTIPSGSTVDLLVSKGPPPVVVPTLIDMRRKAAVAALEDLGLRVNVEAGEFTPLNRVISQVPAAGTEVPKGSTVTIRII